MGADLNDFCSRCVTVVVCPQTTDQLDLKTIARRQIAGDEQRDRIMFDSKTAGNSHLSTGAELIVDLGPVSAPDCQTQHVEPAEVTDKLHADSEQPGKIRTVPIHRRPELLTPCADLINSEWQRSQGARLHFLQKSCPEFPISLVLLQGHEDSEKLLGHIRLSRVVGHGSSLFVESVVVSKAERGKGYGRNLMTETERYARSRGFRRLCLTTHDKQHFYAHLGFVLSTPVQNAGAMSTFVPMEMLLKFSRLPSEDTSMRTQAQIKMDAQGPQRSTDQKSASQPCSLPAPPPTAISILPPPPPPPPPIASSILSSPPPPPPPPPHATSILSSSPPSPPIASSILSSPPPPPPPPPPNATSILSSPPLPPSSPVVQTLTETPYRDAKGLPIFWMHKDI